MSREFKKGDKVLVKWGLNGEEKEGIYIGPTWPYGGHFHDVEIKRPQSPGSDYIKVATGNLRPM